MQQKERGACEVRASAKESLSLWAVEPCGYRGKQHARKSEVSGVEVPLGLKGHQHQAKEESEPERQVEVTEWGAQFLSMSEDRVGVQASRGSVILTG